MVQLHTELRRALFGHMSKALLKCELPTQISLDILKFLQLWDYEGALSHQVNDVLCKPACYKGHASDHCLIVGSLACS